MTTHTCKHCGETKPADAMCKRGGKPSTICRDCFSAKLSKGQRKPKKPTTLAEVVERRTKKREIAPPTPAVESYGELPAARGVRWALEDGLLVLEQDEHNITITLAEFDRLAEIRQRIGASA